MKINHFIKITLKLCRKACELMGTSTIERGFSRQLENGGFDVVENMKSDTCCEKKI